MANKLILVSLLLFAAPLAYGQVKVDTTLTGFHFAADFQGTRVYTLHGAADLRVVNPSVFSYTLMPNATYQAARQQIDYLLAMAKQDGYINSQVLEKDTLIQGKQAYYTSFVQTLAGKAYKNAVFYAFYLQDGAALLFISGDLDNGKYLKRFKQTFYTIQY